MNMQFFSAGAGAITGTVTHSGWVHGQHWLLVDVKGVEWVVPQGCPNNAAPICAEADPEAYQEIRAALQPEAQ